MVQQAIAGTTLPEKEWFYIQEIAERWGCSIEQLTHYAENEMLQVCFNFGQLHCVGRSMLSNAAGKEPTLGPLEWYVRTEGLMGISPYDIARMNREGGVYPSATVYLPDQKYTTLGAVLSAEKELLEEDWQEYHFISINRWASMNDSDFERSSKIWVPPDKLLVTRKERDRFEIKYRVGAHAGVMPSNNELSYSVESENLRVLIRASREFWSTAEPDNPATHTTNETVCKWLEEQGLSKRLAEAGATLIRPSWAKSGRPKKGE